MTGDSMLAEVLAMTGRFEDAGRALAAAEAEDITFPVSSESSSKREPKAHSGAGGHTDAVAAVDAIDALNVPVDMNHVLPHLLRQWARLECDADPGSSPRRSRGRVSPRRSS